MKPEDFSKAKKERFQSVGNQKQMGRREVLNKAGWLALSATTMMVLMKSQPAMAASGGLPAAPTPTPPASGDGWQRTTRT